MAIQDRQALVDGLRRQLNELAEYDYFMGDIAPAPRPWVLLAGQYMDVRSDPGVDWITEKSLVIALAFMWGVQDGAHSIEDDEGELISAMVRELRVHSARAEDIAKAIECLNSGDSEVAVCMSKKLFDEHVRHMSR